MGREAPPPRDLNLFLRVALREGVGERKAFKMVATPFSCGFSTEAPTLFYYLLSLLGALQTAITN
jgi:hypothetical protein